MDSIIYNSFDYDYKTLGEKIFYIKKNLHDQFVVAETLDLITENIIIYEKSDFIQIDLIYTLIDDTDIKLKQMNKLYNIIIDQALYEKYSNFLMQDSIKLYPDNEDKLLYIDIFKIDDVYIHQTKQFYILSIFSKKENISIMVDNMKSTNFSLMNDFFERNDLNDIERKFIINNFQQQEYRKMNKKKNKKQYEDEDFNNFKDFMKKDNTDLSDFKITQEEKKSKN